MKINYYGHSCFSVETSGKTLLFDPFITPNPAAKGIDINSIRADYILGSHGHEDHVADVAAIAKNTGATLVSNFEVVQWFGKKGITKAVGMNHGGTWKTDFGSVKYVNAIHSSSLPDGSYGGNPGGFVVESKNGNFYYSGDTALTLDMQLIGQQTKLAFAVLCVGDHFTMGVNDAIRAAELIHCERIIGVHYDTFPPIKIDHEWAVQQFKSAGKELHLIGIGKSLEI